MGNWRGMPRSAQLPRETRRRSMGYLGRALEAIWRRQANGVPLLRPFHRKVHQPLHAEAAGQPSFDRRRYDRRRDKSQRQSHADGAFALALAMRQLLDRAFGIMGKFVKPAMGVAEGPLESGTRLNAHRPCPR